MTVVSPEDWENTYKEILTSGYDDANRMQEMREKWGEPDDEGRGAFVLVRNEEEQPVSSNFNMG